VALYAHPTTAIIANHQTADELDLMANGVVLPTLADAAESSSTLRTILPAVGLTQADPTDYQINATARPEARVVDIAVDGPSSAAVSRIAAGLPATVGQIANSQFLVEISSSGPPSSATRIVPRTTRNTVAGGASGFLVGIVLAELSMSRQTEWRTRARSGSAPQGAGE
jgi:capsular polysaccharide biosynthesis protein